jgi:hypothetical protein
MEPSDDLAEKQRMFTEQLRESGVFDEPDLAFYTRQDGAEWAGRADLVDVHQMATICKNGVPAGVESLADLFRLVRPDYPMEELDRLNRHSAPSFRSNLEYVRAFVEGALWRWETRNEPRTPVY